MPENRRKEENRLQSRSRSEELAFPKINERNEKRKAAELENIPQQLEQGVYRCPWRAARRRTPPRA